MAYWLLKTEPGGWSWDDQVKEKEGTTHWDGVRNHQASNNMKKMKIGDRCFFYHSVKERQIVGVVEVVKEYYPDLTDPTGRFGMVDVKAIAPVPTPVTLAAIKADPAFGRFLTGPLVAAFGGAGLGRPLEAPVQDGRHRALMDAPRPVALPPPGHVLGPLADITAGAAGLFEFRDGHTRGSRSSCLRQGDGVVGYVNDCPHRHLPLDGMPGRFLTREGTLIQCVNHGAKFRIEDGVCIDGPCLGAGLTPVAVAVEDGAVVLTDRN